MRGALCCLVSLERLNYFGRNHVTDQASKTAFAQRRMHPLAIAVSVLATVVLVLASVPGRPEYGPDLLGNGKYGPHFELEEGRMRHGWPLTFLSHEGVREKQFPWRLSPLRWGSGWVFHVLPFVVDIAVATAIVGMVFAITNRHLRRRGLRVSLRGALATIFCFAGIMAYISGRVRLRDEQITYLRQHDRREYAGDWEPFGPYWLRTLTGDTYWERADRLTRVDIPFGKDLESLPGKRSIKVIQIAQFDCAAPPSLDEFEALVALDVMLLLPPGELDDRGETYYPDDAEYRLGLRAIAQCKQLQGLNLYDNDLGNRDLEILGTMTNLVHLDLTDSHRIDDDGVKHLKSLTRLRRLRLRGTSVSAEGVQSLQTVLPDCEISWDDSLDGH